MAAIDKSIVIDRDYTKAVKKKDRKKLFNILKHEALQQACKPDTLII